MTRAAALPRAASVLFPAVVMALALGIQSAGPVQSGGLTFTVDRTDDPNPAANGCKDSTKAASGCETSTSIP